MNGQKPAVALFSPLRAALDSKEVSGPEFRFSRLISQVLLGTQLLSKSLLLSGLTVVLSTIVLDWIYEVRGTCNAKNSCWSRYEVGLVLEGLILTCRQWKLIRRFMVFWGSHVSFRKAHVRHRIRSAWKQVLEVHLYDRELLFQPRLQESSDSLL
jgi:hypothetical protein